MDLIGVTGRLYIIFKKIATNYVLILQFKKNVGVTFNIPIISMIHCYSSNLYDTL